MNLKPEKESEEKTMKVKTLLSCIMYSFDEVEWYSDTMELISKMCPETLFAEYGNRFVKRFWISSYNDITVLEVIFR